jgi:peptide/nickel transport system permease protein
MLGYLAKRLLYTLPSLFGVLVITFLLARLSGDPTDLFLPVDAPEVARQAFRAEKGLDRPMVEQFLAFAGGVLRGDFGQSLRFGAPSLSLVTERVGATLELAAVTLLISVAVGVPAGAYAACRRGRAFDGAARGTAAFAQAVPTFYWGILSIILFSVVLRWLPTGGRDGWLTLVLPATTLSTTLVALILRVTRSCMLDVLRQDFVRTARAKGVPEVMVVAYHAGRNAIIPVLTVIALQFGVLLGGVVVTETVFSWPGVGRLAIQAIYARDYPVVQAVVFFFALVFILVNLMADLAQAALDPRVRRD